MNIIVNGSIISLVHIRYGGHSYGVRVDEMNDVQEDMTTSEFFTVVENHLDFEVGALSGYESDITAETENMTIHPQAKFGAQCS